MIKLNNETIFYHNLSKDKNKLELLKKASLEEKITHFDQVTLTRLRKLYYGFYSGLIYIYYEETNSNNIGNKLELLTYTMEDKQFQIVHGTTDSTRNIDFSNYGVKELDYNSWIEVKEGNKEWVYDLFSLLKIEKKTYYKLENPKIERTIPKYYITNHPGRSKNDFHTYHNGFDFILIEMIPAMEKNMSTHPFKDILSQEICRYKQEIDFEKIILDNSSIVKKKSH